jgi:replicative DNA helicase
MLTSTKSTLSHAPVHTQLLEREVEAALLSVMLIDHDAAQHCARILREDDFYDPRNRHVFSAICRCDGEPTFLAVNERLTASGALREVGEEYVNDLIANAPVSLAYYRRYASIIADRAERRRIISALGDIAKSVYQTNTPVSEIYADALKRFSESASARSDVCSLTAAEVAERALVKFDERVCNENGLLGIPSGLTDLDSITAGWQNTQLVTIAGRPGTGKSVLLAQSALRAAKSGKRVMYFSLEMSETEVILRMAKNNACLSYKTGEERRLTKDAQEKMRLSIASVCALPLKIRTNSALSTLIAECEVEHRAVGVDLIVIDYLQIAQIDIGDDKGTRDIELSTATRALKQFAMRLNVPVLIGSQLNRQADGVKPSLATLRESGGIENDSNVVIGLWQHDPDVSNVITASVLKNRDGGVGDVIVYFDRPMHRMADAQRIEL